MITTLGIRHHGPGSAKSMLLALRQLEPDMILIEGPPDADKLIPYVDNKKLRPPVALLVYNPKDLKEAAYYPFASFSPEWRAMKYAVKKKIPVRFMDLPRSLAFTLDRQLEEKIQLDILPQSPESDEHPVLDRERKKIVKDPFGYLARIAGFTDSERWWEVTFEATENPQEIFPVIIDMIEALRKEVDHESPPREQRREAFMRQNIRKVISEGYQNIAVICGAWHSPALQYLDRYKASHDKAILRGIKKTTTKATWVPWTYERLSFQSGYGAGVISPAWYRLLYNRPQEAVIRWMSKVARLFRKEDLDSSSAHIIEAVRLAETLATLRGLSIAGIDELRAAAISIFCQGYESRMELIDQKLIIGDVMGKVPPEIPAIPLQQDLDKRIKSTRLTKYRNSTESHWLKATKAEPRGGIDLREPTDLAKSHLLHRLNILKIKWGKLKKGNRRATGSFKEFWKLQWKPDFALAIIEAGMWGNSVERAAHYFLLAGLKDLTDLPELTEKVEAALQADLTDALPHLTRKLQEVSALTEDVYHLMDALPPLINALRYGSTRQLDIENLQQVVDQLIPRICIGLPNASVSLDEEASRHLFEKVLQCNRSITLLEQDQHLDSWHRTLASLSSLPQVNESIQGACTRILFDKSLTSTDEVVTQMHYALSRTNDSFKAAHWVEGFLHGSGLLLIHHPALWRILDDWVDGLSPEVFKDILPLLRRTFSEYSGAERSKMMELAKRGKTPEKAESEQNYLDQFRAEQLRPIVRQLLGN